MSDDHAFHLTPLDVRSQEFARTLRGYDRAQVDEFKLAISEELERLLRDPETRHRMGTAGRARVEEHFSSHATVRAVSRLYAELERSAR